MIDLPDIQQNKPSVQIPINQVGVENVEVPFKLESKYGGFHQMVANVSMRTNLDENTKGISMSRLIRTLKPYLDLPLKHTLIKLILEDIRKNVGGTASFMKFEFKLPIIKKSIKSDNEFPLYYKCRFEGQLYDTNILEEENMDHIVTEYRFYQGVIVQYASYCPCSAELCQHLTNQGKIGFPHNQRSFAHILVESKEPNYVWLENIIEVVELATVNRVYPIIKRDDEQGIAELAAQNPMFVEDAIRNISVGINGIPGVHDWIIKCNHEESIHTSEAIAINWKGIGGGFNGRRFI
jgi:GTP cyclohydrolase I